MDTKTESLITIDPCNTHLRLHASIKHFPSWPDDDARFESLCDTIAAGAPLLPVLITSRHEALDPDSFCRWRAAKRLQLPEIPAILVPEDRIAITALTALVQRQHLSRSARAYLAFPLLARIVEENKLRRTQNLQNCPIFPKTDKSGFVATVEAWARQYGFSGDLYLQAKKVHEIFVRDAEYKAQMEPRILADPIGGEHEDHRPVGLGAVIAGWGGKKATDDQPRPETRQLFLFQQGIVRLTYWGKFNKEDKAAARDAIAKTLETSPDDLLAELDKATRRELQRRKEEGK